MGKQGTLREKCPNKEFYLSVFSRTRGEQGDLRNKSPYSAQVLENTDQKKLRIWTPCTQWKSVQNCCNQKLVIGNLKPFFRKARQRIQNCSKGNYFKKLFWSCLEVRNEYSERLKIAFFTLADFWVMKLKPFSRKPTQSIQNYLNPKFVIIVI